jgi:hypothetical protein
VKKTLAYLATAIVLGFVAARLPLAIQAGQPAYLSPLSPPSTQFMNTPTEQGATKNEVGSTLRSYGIAGHPLLPSSLVFFSGLIAALTAYVIVKRRMP